MKNAEIAGTMEFGIVACCRSNEDDHPEFVFGHYYPVVPADSFPGSKDVWVLYMNDGKPTSTLCREEGDTYIPYCELQGDGEPDVMFWRYSPYQFAYFAMREFNDIKPVAFAEKEE